MLTNQSMPTSTVIPVLSYPDVDQAVDWLASAFGFTLRWQAGSHRAQLNVGDGCVAVTHGAASSDPGISLMVRVEDVDAHHTRARAAGARILLPPQDFPYGERQYGVLDLAGHHWTFSQSIADVDPQSWGARIGEL